MMPMVTDFGKDGPHPDVLSSLTEKLNEEPFIDFREVDEVRESDIHVLQQRTLYGVSWSNLSGRNWAHDEDVIGVDVSVGLAVNAPEGSRSQLVMYMSYRLPDRDWSITRTSLNQLEDPPKKPWTSIGKLSRGLGIAWGVLAHSPDLGRLRISLEDGRVAESIVSNGSALMFVQFNSAQLWSSTVKHRLYDTRGREILADDLDLGSLSPSS